MRLATLTVCLSLLMPLKKPVAPMRTFSLTSVDQDHTFAAVGRWICALRGMRSRAGMVKRSRDG